MLRHKADVRSVVFMIINTSLLIIQWRLGEFHPLLFVTAMFMAVPVAVIAHNHNHVPVWKADFMNTFQDYWLTLFYGYPAFGWIPTHNTNHHVHNNRVPDYTITYRMSEDNNLITLLTYPSISGGVQQRANIEYVKELWRKNRKKCLYSLSQVLLLFVYMIAAFILSWKKALLYIFLPQQMSLFAVLIFNYIQHVHADEESKWNHSRNYVGRSINYFLLNNGYHTVHHMHPRRHWSENRAAHEQIAHNIDPALIEKSFWWYIVRVYFLGAISPKFKTVSMRLARLEKERAAKSSQKSPAPRIADLEPVAQP